MRYILMIIITSISAHNDAALPSQATLIFANKAQCVRAAKALKSAETEKLHFHLTCAPFSHPNDWRTIQ